MKVRLVKQTCAVVFLGLGLLHITLAPADLVFPFVLSLPATTASSGPGTVSSNLSGFWDKGSVTSPMAIAVALDIKPGGDPNAVNPRSRGVIPVAILMTDSFDVTTADPSTVQFGPGGAGIGHRSVHLEDVDDDGDLDLLLRFRTQQTGIACGDTEASLTGQIFDGTPIEGSDSIVTVGCK